MTVGQYYWLIKALDTGMDWPWQYSFPPFFTIQVSNHVLINFILSHIPDDCFFTPPASQRHQSKATGGLETFGAQLLPSNYFRPHAFTTGAVKTCTNCCVGEHNICPGSGRRRRLASLPQQLHIKKITCGSNTHSPWRSCPTVSEIIHVRAIIWSKCNFPVETWNGRTRANAEVTYSGNLRRSLAKRYTSEIEMKLV